MGKTIEKSICPNQPRGEYRELLKFHSLRDKIFNLKNLNSAFKHVKKNKGKAGLDRVSIHQFEADLENNIQAIHKRLRTEVYKPLPVVRVFYTKRQE